MIDVFLVRSLKFGLESCDAVEDLCCSGRNDGVGEVRRIPVAIMVIGKLKPTLKIGGAFDDIYCTVERVEGNGDIAICRVKGEGGDLRRL